MASVQSKTTCPPSRTTMFHGWRSPCARVGGGPSSSSRRHAATIAGVAARHRARSSAERYGPANGSSVMAGTAAARWPRGSSRTPASISSSVCPDQARWMSAKTCRACAPPFDGLVPEHAAPEVLHQHPALGGLERDDGRHEVLNPGREVTGEHAFVPEQPRTGLHEVPAALDLGAQDRGERPQVVQPGRRGGRPPEVSQAFGHPGRRAAEPSRPRPGRLARVRRPGAAIAPRGELRPGLGRPDGRRVEVPPRRPPKSRAEAGRRSARARRRAASGGTRPSRPTRSSGAGRPAARGAPPRRRGAPRPPGTPPWWSRAGSTRGQARPGRGAAGSLACATSTLMSEWLLFMCGSGYEARR